MKLSSKFQSALDRYLEWSKCTTPFTGFAAAEKHLHSSTLFPLGNTAAEEIIFERETHGTCSAVGCSHPQLLAQYERGKANRDWWFKEKGWWNKNASYVPEDFLVHLTDECFFELFGRFPIPEIVRRKYDNHYSSIAFTMDMKIKLMIFEGKLIGYERDYRKSWWNIFITVVLKRKLDRWVWKLKHPFGCKGKVVVAR